MIAWKTGWACAALLGAAVVAVAIPAEAQMPPPAAPGAEIASCLCLHRSLTPLAADMHAKVSALDAVRHQLSALDAELTREKPRVDVNNPQSVAQYKALLDRHDAAYGRSNGAVYSDATAAVARYDTAVHQYNSECANRPFDSVLMHQIEAKLACPAPR